MASVSMVIVTELVRDSLKSVEESLCSVQKMSSDRFIKKQQIENSFLRLFQSIIFVWTC